jgi:hypothetical protein
MSHERLEEPKLAEAPATPPAVAAAPPAPAPSERAHAPATETARPEATSRPTDTRGVDDYFHGKLLGIPIVQEYFERLRSRLPPGRASELLAIYVGEGPVRNGDPDFVRFMTGLHKEVRSRSAEIADLIRAQDAVLKEDAFTYQMTLNLIAQLKLGSDEKADLFGRALTIPYAKDEKGGPTLMAANITNAFILMKSAGVTREQALPYIKQGLAVNSGDPDAMREYVARARTYFPGSI